MSAPQTLAVTQGCLNRITEYLSSFLNKSEAFCEPYISDSKTFLLPGYPELWVVTQFNTPKFVNFAFRPLDELVEQELPEPVVGEYVAEPLTRFKVPAYFLASIRKAALVNSQHADLFFAEIRKLVQLSLEHINHDPDLYSAGATDCPNLLRRAEASGNRAIRFATALNWNCPPEVIARLSESPDPLILKAVACNPNLSPDQQLSLLCNPHLDERGACAIASRRTLDARVRQRLEQYRLASVQSYLSGPRVIDYLDHAGSDFSLPDTVAFFKHLLGQEYLQTATRFNRHYFDYLSRHEDLEVEELLCALESQQIATRDGRKLLQRLLGRRVNKTRLLEITNRLVNSIENAKQHRELGIKPFSFIVQYEHVWSLRWRRPDLNFNLTLEYASDLYYPDRISIAEIDRCLTRHFFHLWNSICWCSGPVTEYDGKTVLFILELQCDFFRLKEAHVRKYFRDWSQVLLNLVIVEAKRRGVEAIYMLSVKALVALYGKLYGMSYEPAQEGAWRRIYDDNAARLGMRTMQTRPVNIYTETWNHFDWDEFYYARIDELESRELVDSSYTAENYSEELDFA